LRRPQASAADGILNLVTLHKFSKPNEAKFVQNRNSQIFSKNA
jgi:hypothetical protein